VVLAHASPSERKPACLPVSAASVLSGSRVERARRSSLVTMSVAGVELVDRTAELRAVRLRAA
jgi:hypothetical protein